MVSKTLLLKPRPRTLLFVLEAPRKRGRTSSRRHITACNRSCCEMMCSLAKRAAICNDKRRSPPAPSLASNKPRKLLFLFSFFFVEQSASAATPGVSELPAAELGLASPPSCFELFFRSRDFLFLFFRLPASVFLPPSPCCCSSPADRVSRCLRMSSSVHEGVAVTIIFGIGRDVTSGLTADAVTMAPRRKEAA